jgi:hypothetical protein
MGWSLSGSDGIRTGVLAFYFDAFSSREPVSTSLENALARPRHARTDVAKLHRTLTMTELFDGGLLET